MSESAHWAPDTDADGETLGAALLNVGSGVGLADDAAGADPPLGEISHHSSPRTTRIPMTTMMRRRQ